MSLALARQALSGAPLSARREPVTATRLPAATRPEKPAPVLPLHALRPVVWEHSMECTCGCREVSP